MADERPIGFPTGLGKIPELRRVQTPPPRVLAVAKPTPPTPHSTIGSPYQKLADHIQHAMAREEPPSIIIKGGDRTPGRRDLDEPDTYYYSVEVLYGGSGLRPVKMVDIPVCMDAEDHRHRTPEQELLEGLNFHLKTQGLEARLGGSTGQGWREITLNPFQEAAEVPSSADAYHLTTSSTNGALVLEVPGKETILIPEELKDRWRREAIQWYQENGHRNAQRQA